MLHHEILQEIKDKRQQVSFMYPDYGRYSIAEIPPSVLSFFGIHNGRPTLPFESLRNVDKKYDKLLFFFVDGFGYDDFVDFEKEFPFFNMLRNRADVYPLTSVFPSTTAAALTTIHTGLTPQEHGLPEWTVYFEELDRISFGTLKEKEGTPEMLYSGSTVYSDLRGHGIKPYVFTYEGYLPSAYSSVSQKGAEMITFKDAEDLFPKLIKTLKEETGPAYYFVYWGDVDTIEHMHGPRSKEHLTALNMLSMMITEFFIKKIDEKTAERIMFVMSSDHGHANIRNEDIIYLNSYLDLETSYSKTVAKKNIYPTGAPHDVFLHVDPSKIESTLIYLRDKLRGKADVITTKEAVEKGLFGLNKPTVRFLKRIGDIIILPYEGYHVWYQHTPEYFWKQLGIHGGLSRSEMLVPFVVSPLVNLL